MKARGGYPCRPSPLEDLKTYAHRQRHPPHELVRRWLQPEKLIPPGALLPERQLFEADLKTLLPVLAHG